MKLVLATIAFFFAYFSFSQEWRDSLDVARRAYQKKDYKKALQYYESAQRKAPENIDLSDEIGQSAYRSGDYNRAQKVYEQNAESKQSKKRKADNLHNIGNAQLKQKNYQAAIESYKESLRNNPDSDETRYNLSKALRELKKQQNQQQQNNGSGNSDENQNQGDQQGNQQQDGDQKKQNNGQPKQDQQGDPQNPKDKPKDQQKKGSSQGKKNNSQQQGQLGDKNVDKILDELMKREAETKRRMYGSRGGYAPKSGKDW